MGILLERCPVVELYSHLITARTSRSLSAVLGVYFLGLAISRNSDNSPYHLLNGVAITRCTIEGSLVDAKDVIRLQAVTDQLDKPWASDPWRKNDATSVSRKEEPSASLWVENFTLAEII